MADYDEDCATGDQDVGNIERIRVIDSAAAHIEVIRHRTVDYAIESVAKRAADDGAGRQRQYPAALVTHPCYQPQRDSDGKRDKQPAATVVSQEAEIDACIPGHHKIEIGRPHVDSVHRSQIEPINNDDFGKSVEAEGDKC